MTSVPSALQLTALYECSFRESVSPNGPKGQCLFPEQIYSWYRPIRLLA